MELRTKFIAETKKTLSNVEKFCVDLKEDCDTIETMLCEFGYKPPQEKTKWYIQIFKRIYLTILY